MMRDIARDLPPKVTHVQGPFPMPVVCLVPPPQINTDRGVDHLPVFFLMDKAISCPSVSTSSITRFWSRSIFSGHASGVVHLGGAGLPCSFLLASVGPYCQPLFVCFLEIAPILAVGGS